MKGIAELKIIKKNKSFYVIKKDQKNKNLLILLYECHWGVPGPVDKAPNRRNELARLRRDGLSYHKSRGIWRRAQS